LTVPLNESTDERTEIWRGEQEVMKRGLEQLSKVRIGYDFVVDK